MPSRRLRAIGAGQRQLAAFGQADAEEDRFVPVARAGSAMVKSRPSRMLHFSSTPSDRMASISCRTSSRGRRNTGTPAVSMPPGSASASNTVTL